MVCLEIDLEGFANQLIASLSVSNQEYTETVYYLLAPIYSLNFTMSYSPQILFNVTDTNLQDVSYASGTYTIPTNLQPYFEWSPVLTPNTSSLLVYRSELIDTLYQLPVIVNDTDGQQNIAAYFFLQNSYKSSVITPTNQQAEVLSTLLIPSIMLIGLSVLITLLILRTLLNGLDQELNKLNERCKFIVEGDIAI